MDVSRESRVPCVMMRAPERLGGVHFDAALVLHILFPGIVNKSLANFSNL
jgi:hypothetical protein